MTDDPSVQEVVPATNATRTDWPGARKLIDEACASAKEAGDAENAHNDNLAIALGKTMRIIEAWRGEYRAEVDSELGGCKPKDEKNLIISVVKYVFPRVKNKSSWTHYANALRWAEHEKRTSDDLEGFFGKTRPTQAALLWRQSQPAKEKVFDEVPFGDWPAKLPDDCKPKPGEKPKAIPIKAVADGKFVWLVPKRKASKAKDGKAAA